MKSWESVYTEVTAALKNGLGAREGDDLNFAATNFQCLNERHLHHQFSNYLKTQGIGVFGTAKTKAEDLLLFPEYPTSKEDVTHRPGIWYWKKHEQEPRLPAYRDVPPDPGGQPVGHLDFVIGRMGKQYFEPEIAVEFKLGLWFKEEVAFDFLKLLDPRMNYKACISANVVISNIRRHHLPPVFRAKRGTLNTIDIFEASILHHSAGYGAPDGRLCHIFAIDWLQNGGIDMWEFQHEFQGKDMAPFLEKIKKPELWSLTSRQD